MNEIQVTVRGNLGADPELQVFPSGSSIVKFSVGSTPRWPGRDGGEWKDGSTTWVTVECRKTGLAENVRASLRKGQPVIVQGRLKQSTWEQEGVKRERLVLLADAVGYDLNRGTSTFIKVTRAEGPDEEGPEVRVPGEAGTGEASIPEPAFA